MAFTYRARNSEQWDKRANQQGGDFEGFIRDDYRVWSPKKGPNAVRILPPTFDDPDHYGINVYVHYSVGPAKASVLCLQSMKNSRCPICEARNRALKLGDEEEARVLKPVKRVLVWMLDRNDEQRGPMLWAMAYTLDKDFCALAKDPQTGEISPLDHPDDGYDIFFDKTGEALLTQYGGKKLARRPSPVSEEALDYIEDRPLTGTLVWRNYDEIKELYEGGPPEDAGAVVPRDPPPRRGGAEVEVSRRHTNGEDHVERPARRVQAEEDEPVARDPEPVRRRVAAPEASDEYPRSRRDQINEEVPFRTEAEDKALPRNLRNEEPAPATSVADRLAERYRR